MFTYVNRRDVGFTLEKLWQFMSAEVKFEACVVKSLVFLTVPFLVFNCPYQHYTFTFPLMLFKFFN